MFVPNPPGWELFKAYEDLEDAINKTKWWQFGERRKLRNTLCDIRTHGAIIGFESGIKDLIDAGLLNES